MLKKLELVEELNIGRKIMGLIKYEDCLRGIVFENYKSFKDKTKFCFANNITLLIGKNNSGKSSVLDIIEYSLDRSMQNKKILVDNITIACDINKNNFKYGFVSEVNFTTSMFWNSNMLQLQDKYYPLEIVNNKELNDDLLLEEEVLEYSCGIDFARVDKKYEFDLEKYNTLRLNAERNIVPEKEELLKHGNMEIGKGGNGATNLIRAYLNDADKDEKIIQVELLEELNEIMSPEACYENIKVQQNIIDGLWEVYLTEKGGRRIPLSKTGSGLKTVILVLINLLVLTKERLNGDKYIYLFEELENNLHPSLQRRLYRYLYNFVKETNDRIVLTTHSPVAINSIYGEEGNGIYHVIKKESSTLLPLLEHKGKRAVLADLDVKASDLFQANGIIWVEGPSDRVYIKHWMEILCENKYKEGADYQFLYYGGKLLSRYTAKDMDDCSDEELEDLINILKVNRNAVIVMDSDKQQEDEPIRKSKLRVKSEMEANDYLVWITEGKEIENYIPAEAVNKRFSSEKSQVEKYEPFNRYIEELDDSFSSHKVEFAKDIVKYINRENMGVLDLTERISELIARIEQWNTNA